MLLPACFPASQAEVSHISVLLNLYLLDDSSTAGPFDQEPSKQKTNPKPENINMGQWKLGKRKREKKLTQNPGCNADVLCFQTLMTEAKRSSCLALEPSFHSN